MPSMRKEFQTLADDHRTRLGVAWTITGENLSGLYRAPAAAKGTGAAAMREICALADQLGVPLTLCTSVEKLVPWFACFGFRTVNEIQRGTSYCVTYFRREPVAL